MTDDPTKPLIPQRLLDMGIGPVVGVLAWSFIMIVAIIATAQSAKPWDTLIAAGAAISQAFFAFMVWRLGQAQYAFTQRITDRQHKIDAYPLRESVAQRLNLLGDTYLLPPRPMNSDAVEAFRYCHTEIARLFSARASHEAFDLYETVMEAQSMMVVTPAIEDDGGSIVIPGHNGMTDDVIKMMHYAIDVLIDLQNILEEEMNIG